MRAAKPKRRIAEALWRNAAAEHSGGALRRSTPAERSAAWVRRTLGLGPKLKWIPRVAGNSQGCGGVLRWMVPLDGSAGWFHWMVPLHGPATWARCMGPLHGSAAWVRCMGPLHGSAAWVRCMGPLPPHSVACKPLRSNGHTLRAVSAAIAPVQPLPLTVWRVSHCVVMVTPCALCFGCSLKLKRTASSQHLASRCSVVRRRTSRFACVRESGCVRIVWLRRHQTAATSIGREVEKAFRRVANHGERVGKFAAVGFA